MIKRVTVLICVLLNSVACEKTTTASDVPIAVAPQGETKMSDPKKTAHLTPEQKKVTQLCATENPFNNEYWNHHEPGIYVDIVDGKPLFGSADKFDSGTGWPSFTQPLDENSLKVEKDTSHGMVREEVKSKAAGSHLGHVFDDGPGPTKKRFCINSASLRFVHVLDLESSGYGKYLKLFSKELIEKEKKKREEKMKNGEYQTAILAGGCFWGVQDLIRKIPGVLQTEVGYTGGATEKPVYEEVKTGKTGHAESVKIVFDPKKVTYETLLDHFFRLHDPTTPNQQGNDRGTQYRSVIFYANDAQKQAAEKKIKEWNATGKWNRPIVTELVKATPFYSAEGYHQDYLVKNPEGYTCHYYREF